ncbi:hypothetical protein OFL26_17065, partial [Pseudomonas aeruginosa]|nr:hypothetical protein [Pseudomonas aeruginosa]
MNVTPFTQQQADDYRTFMQQAARRFIEKHAAEHLDDDGLFERTVSYLVNSLDVAARTPRRPGGGGGRGRGAAGGGGGGERNCAPPG